jgi:hypothetical protein
MCKAGRLSLMFILLAFSTGLAAAPETDISGGWKLTIQSPRGPMAIDMRIVQEDAKLTVTMTGPRGSESTGKGTIQGRDVQWSIKRSMSSGERAVVYKGTVEGTAMSGTADLGELGTVGWTATKQ